MTQKGRGKEGGSAVRFHDPEPWSEPVDGAQLLNDLAHTMGMRGERWMRQSSMERRFLSPREAAAWLGVSKSAVLRWVRQGRLPAARLGRAIRIDIFALEEVGAKGLPSKPDEKEKRHG